MSFEIPKGARDQWEKAGWLEKFAVGRGLIKIRNWQKRWFHVDHEGLRYSKADGAKQTLIPFVQQSRMPNGSFRSGHSQSGEVMLRPVFIYPNVTTDIHPEAKDPKYSYFAVRFDEGKGTFTLLLRTASEADRTDWVRFMSLFLHAGAKDSIDQHPLALKRNANGEEYDPEDLTPRERMALKSQVLAWDDGVGDAPAPIPDVDIAGSSEDETSPRRATAAASAEAVEGATEEDEGEMLSVTYAAKKSYLL